MLHYCHVYSINIIIKININITECVQSYTNIVTSNVTIRVDQGSLSHGASCHNGCFKKKTIHWNGASHIRCVCECQLFSCLVLCDHISCLD